MAPRVVKIYAGLFIRFDCWFSVAIVIESYVFMVLHIGASVDGWNASHVVDYFSKEHANQILGFI